MQSLLDVASLRSGYGSALVVDGITFSLKPGEALAVLGRNGTGKTTLLNSLIGATTYVSGSILLEGQPIERMRPEARAALGIGWVPQERNIFKSLTVEENMTAVARPGAWNLERAYAMFPRLAERKRNLGNQLSGGEQQMLAVARALMLNPKILLLDEPTEGLAPIIVEELMRALTRIFREEGMAGLIVEQHAQKILKITDRAIILDRGRIVHQAASATLIEHPEDLEAYLGVAAVAH